MIRSGPAAPGRDHDRRSRRGEPQRVVDQVVDGLADAVWVDVRGAARRGRRTWQRHARPTGPAAACSALRVSSDRDVGPFPARGDPVLVAAGEEEQLVGDAAPAGRPPRRRCATAAASSSRLLPGRPASSSSPRSTANGVRSSWLASATSARCRASARCSRRQQLVHRRRPARRSRRGSAGPGRRAPRRARTARRPRAAAARPGRGRRGPARRRRARPPPRRRAAGDEPAADRRRRRCVVASRARRRRRRPSPGGQPAVAASTAPLVLRRTWSARTLAMPRLRELGRGEQRDASRRRRWRRGPGRTGR